MREWSEGWTRLRVHSPLNRFRNRWGPYKAAAKCSPSTDYLTAPWPLGPSLRTRALS